MLLAVYSTIDNLSLQKHTFAKLPDALSEKAYRKVNWVKLLIALRLELAPTGKTFLPSLPTRHATRLEGAAPVQLVQRCQLLLTLPFVVRNYFD